MDIGKLAEWIKLSPRHLVLLSLFAGFALFAPKRWLSVLAQINLAKKGG